MRSLEEGGVRCTPSSLENARRGGQQLFPCRRQLAARPTGRVRALPACRVWPAAATHRRFSEHGGHIRSSTNGRAALTNTRGQRQSAAVQLRRASGICGGCLVSDCSGGAFSSTRTLVRDLGVPVASGRRGSVHPSELAAFAAPHLVCGSNSSRRGFVQASKMTLPL